MVRKRDIAKYTLLPGILPRLSVLFSSGFAHVSFLLAVVYQAVRLLPASHPYVNPDNFGKFGIRHVVAAAANNLVLDRHHIDQIVVFFALFAGLIVLVMQFGLFVLALTMGHPALAGEALLAPQSMWGEPTLGHSQDIAAILLDRVFGLKAGFSWNAGDGEWAATDVGGFFGSCVGTPAADCTNLDGAVIDSGGDYPWAFHIAFHQFLGFYSQGIFFIGFFIVIYYVTTIVAETAVNGSPFGQRLNKTWAPFRLMLFIFLLIPVDAWSDREGTYASGLNFAQLFLMKVVYTGSNFATNSWVYFNTQGGGVGSTLASDSYLSQQQQIIATPTLDVTEIKDFIYFMGMAHTCRSAYLHQFGTKYLTYPDNDFFVDAYVIRSQIPASLYGEPPEGESMLPNALLLRDTEYMEAKNFNLGGDITIRIGYRAPQVGGKMHENFNFYRGNIMPLCGDMTLRIVGGGEPAFDLIQKQYFDHIKTAWNDMSFTDEAKCLVLGSGADSSCTEAFTSNLNDWRKNYHDLFTATILAGIELQKTDGVFNIPEEILRRGWAGAALWYNKISEMNGAVTSAAFNLPRVSLLPYPMEKMFNEMKEQSSNMTVDTMYDATMDDSSGRNIQIDWKDDRLKDISKTLVEVNQIFRESDFADAGSLSQSSGNAFLDFVNLIYGTSGIFEMRKNTDVHPLGQLSSLGRGMMEAVTRNALLSAGFSLKAKSDDLVGKNKGQGVAKQLSGLFFTLVITTLGMAVILYYVLPLMPFLYFFFAVSGWLKSIFEAMVAMPLWALAHLRIDGEGVMGPAAFNGYALLLEIFLRPTLILTGLLASIATFSALVGVLNIIFDLVVANVGGFDYAYDSTADSSMLGSVMRGVDEFFYTAMYTIICYMMGLASFKMVDLIPNQILRWMGLSVSTFQENAGDPVSKLTGNVKRSSILIANQLRGRLSGLAEL